MLHAMCQRFVGLSEKFFDRELKRASSAIVFFSHDKSVKAMTF